MPQASSSPTRRARATAVLAGVTALVIAAVVASAFTVAQAAKAPAAQARRISAPPLPPMGFAPVRPIDVVKATYDFAAQHPEVLRYVPCFCGCGMEAGHKNNESCFVARRDAAGNVVEWDTHGWGCTICVDVAREAMQLHASGASVSAIRAAIDKKWAPTHPGMATPTAMPPARKP